MKRITREELVREISREYPAVEGAEPGEEIIFETSDRPFATGPVAILGAKPGDVLVVDILEITGGEAVTNSPEGWRAVIGFIGVEPEKGEAPVPISKTGGMGRPVANEVVAGTRVSLPVLVPGANLAVGLVHLLDKSGAASVAAAPDTAPVKALVRLRASLFQTAPQTAFQTVS